VPLDAAAADALRRWKAGQRKERLRAGSLWQVEVDWLFTTETGTPLDVQNVGRWYAAEAKSAGVGGTPHRLRQTFASLLLADGESVRNVAELLWHSKTSTTWDTYGHVAVETQRAAVQRLSGLLGA
jgi:site-specific recombinase XerD